MNLSGVFHVGNGQTEILFITSHLERSYSTFCYCLLFDKVATQQLRFLKFNHLHEALLSILQLLYKSVNVNFFYHRRVITVLLTSIFYLLKI